MGCGVSHSLRQPTGGTTTKSGPGHGAGELNGSVNTNGSHVVAGGAPNGTRREVNGSGATASTGKEKYLGHPILRESNQDGKVYQLAVYCNTPKLDGLTFACRDALTGTVWMRTMDEEEVVLWKNKSASGLPWPVFWKYLTAAFTNTLRDPPRSIAIPGNKRRLDISIRGVTREDRHLLPTELANCGADPSITYTCYFLPFLESYTKRKTDRTRQEAAAEAAEPVINESESLVEETEGKIEALRPGVEVLRAELREVNQEKGELAGLEKQVLRAIKHRSVEKGTHHLDALYNDGGARPFQHAFWAKEHEPVYIQTCPSLLQLLVKAHENALDGPPRPPITDVAASLKGKKPLYNDIETILQCIDAVDEHNFDPFLLDKMTNGGALVYTAWALTYKYDLVNAFNLDPEVVKNFWVAVTAGYHPNPYHNATHAADVMQCTHYIMDRGKMRSLIRMKKEDEFACLLAAGIHDYDHPGFNNNFHTKTQAYLGVLYNDRSILENHHCACVFELMRHAKYNILAPLSEDQRKEVRDTVIELLLCTDMGNHSKIMIAFRRRYQESPDWHSRRDDVKNAMVMAIKMADISNCSRPHDLYMRWADRIAEEFYNQGDYEHRLDLPASPFMSRRKHQTDFPLGQISFMSYIVLPMFEDVVNNLLPSLSHVVKQVEQNRAYWQQNKAKDNSSEQ